MGPKAKIDVLFNICLVVYKLDWKGCIQFGQKNVRMHEMFYLIAMNSTNVSSLAEVVRWRIAQKSL